MVCLYGNQVDARGKTLNARNFYDIRLGEN